MQIGFLSVFFHFSFHIFFRFEASLLLIFAAAAADSPSGLTFHYFSRGFSSLNRQWGVWGHFWLTASASFFSRHKGLSAFSAFSLSICFSLCFSASAQAAFSSLLSIIFFEVRYYSLSSLHSRSFSYEELPFSLRQFRFRFHFASSMPLMRFHMKVSRGLHQGISHVVERLHFDTSLQSLQPQPLTGTTEYFRLS